MTEQRIDLGADSHGNIVVQIEGDQNTVQIGPRPKLLLTRFVAQRRIQTGKAHSELQQLSPYTLSTTLVGRDAELADLDRFLHSTESISVRVLTGDGGSGKTRLALHLCEQMADQGWLAGFATSDAFRKFNAQPDRAEWGWSRPTLVVIDYAASHTELLKDWLDALADRLGQVPALTQPLRILLLERHANPQSGWMAELCASGGWASIGGRHKLFDPPEPVAVLPLIDPADRASLLNQMLQRNGFSGPQVSAEFVERHLSAASWGRDPLFLMMAALHAVQQGRIDALALRRTDLAQRLAMREGERLDRLAAAHQTAPLNKQLLRHLSACITLAQGLDRDAFLPLVSQESEATGRPNGGDPAEFHDLLVDALPTTDDGRLPPLLPDLIGEAFVLNTLAAQKINPAGLQRLYATLGLPMVQTLARCAQDFATQDTDLPLQWLQALVQAASSDLNRLRQINQTLPNESVVLRGLKLEIAMRGKALAERPEASVELKAWHLSQASIAYSEMDQREEALEAAREAVEIYRALAQNHPDAFRPDLAMSLNNVASFLSDLGQREAALEAAREAVEIYRALARNRPNTFHPNLAGSLNNVANRLSDLGLREAALEAAQEAVEIYRALPRNRQDAFRPDWAISLNNVAIRLSDLGQREEALEAAREAVEIYRALAQNHPDAFRPNLAMSLNSVANRLSDLGQREEALEAAQEAVEIRRELARNRPAAFRPYLAGSLNTLANRLSDLGLREAALEAAREAVEIYQALARRRPDAFRPDWAMSLNNVANRLSDLGQREEALEAAREAVKIYRELALNSPDTFRSDLAMSLNTVANRLSGLGQREDALGAAQEAVEIYKELARNRPDAFLPDLAGSLNNVACFLRDLGKREDALEAARAAVEIRRELARNRPDAFRPDLARSLSNVACFLGDLGRREEALEAAREAVEVYRALAQNRPDAFRPDLAGSLNNVASFLSALVQKEEALEAAREAVNIYRELALNRPDTFRSDLAMSLNNVACFLSDLGQREEALEAAREAVEIYRALAQNRPDACRPNLARSLAVLGLRLEESGAPMVECVTCFAEAIVTLTPAFLCYTAGLISLMLYLSEAYEEKAQNAGIEPDMALLIPIQEVMQGLQPDPEHQGEPT